MCIQTRTFRIWEKVIEDMIKFLKTLTEIIIAIIAIPFAAIVATFAMYCIFFPVTIPLTLLILLFLLLIL